DIAPCDDADAWDIEDLAHLSTSKDMLHEFWLEQTLQRRFDIGDEVVDDRVQADIDALAVGQLLGLRGWSHVEADDDGIGGRGQHHIALGNAADRPLNDAKTYLARAQFFDRVPHSLDRALHIGFDQDVEFFHLAFFDLAIEILK